MPTISPDELRQVMRHWITGVTIVTCSDGNKQHGMTVNSFNSLSLDPAFDQYRAQPRCTHAAADRKNGRVRRVDLRGGSGGNL